MSLKKFWIQYTDNVNHRKVEACIAASPDDAKRSFIYVNKQFGNNVVVEKVTADKESYAL